MEQAIIDLIPTVILQAPSLGGMVFALIVLSNHNRRLLTLLEKMVIGQSGDDEEDDTSV